MEGRKVPSLTALSVHQKVSRLFWTILCSQSPDCGSPDVQATNPPSGAFLPSLTPLQPTYVAPAVFVFAASLEDGLSVMLKPYGPPTPEELESLAISVSQVTFNSLGAARVKIQPIAN
jgi:hypothetical protein